MITKRIGVLTNETHGFYQTDILKGIIQKAREKEYDVVVFTNFTKEDPKRDVEIGEANIFEMINFQELSGVIVLADTFKIVGLPERIIEKLKKECKVPVVFVDYDEGHDYSNIYVDDEKSFEQMIDHLIDIHDCRDILFYSGPKNVTSTVRRYKGYMNSLEKHDMLDCENARFDGDFWYRGGKKLAGEIADGLIKKPDAVAFCGDFMAIGAVEELKRRGIKVPEDILITGYDGVDEAVCMDPSITSCRPPFEVTGKNAMRKLLQLMGDSPEYKQENGDGNIFLGGSCNCGKHNRFVDKITTQRVMMEQYKDFLSSNMMEELVDAESLVHLFERIIHFLYLEKGWEEYYLCLCDNWERCGVTDNDADYPDFGYTDKMKLYIDAEKTGYRISMEDFKLQRMLPALYYAHEDPRVYYFVPVHLGRKRFGYSVIRYEDPLRIFTLTYMNWTKHMCNALEYYRMQCRITNLASTDVVTGILSRFGLAQYKSMVTQRIGSKNSRFLVVSIDADGLKIINDTYGHKAGDILLVKVAECVRAITGKDEICARTGGDEFTIYGCRDYEEGYEDRLIEKFLSEIARINAGKEVEFEISASIGAVIKHIENDSEIDELFKIADDRMYEMKQQNKKQRKE